jgi:hydrogenase 3 maturation protease
MTTLKKILKNRLKGAARIAVLGIGSELRGDDAAGMIIAGNLQAYARKNKTRSFKVFYGGTAPENITGQIRKFRPAHIIIIDATESGQKAGTVKIINTDAEAGESFSTHRLPIKIFNDYLCTSLGCKTTIIGIQPKSLEFGFKLSSAMQEAVGRVSDEVTCALKELLPT